MDIAALSAFMAGPGKNKGGRRNFSRIKKMT
jgi:hypothetical protein